MKIVQIVYSLDMGGIEEFAVNFASSLAADGIDSTIINLSIGRDREWCDNKIAKVRKNGSELIDISALPRIGKFFKLNFILLRLKPDFVIIHHESNTMKVIPAYILGTLKIIQIQHNTKINCIRAHKLLKHAISVYVAVSDDVGNALAELVGIRNNRIEVINNGINAVDFPGFTKHDGPVVVLAAGRFEKQKNFIVLSEILIDVLQEADGAEAVIAGSGGEHDKVREMTKGFPNIELPGNVADMKELYEQADIYISYSIHEGFSIALLEAMASGCAVLSTATSGAKDIIENGVNGILFDINDRGAFADELKVLLADRNKIAKLGKAAAESAKNYDFSVTYGKYMDLLGGMIGNE
ncbi:MAG: glycosyltransferase family 4 protein [Clostridia bacterium]|nr:glycosyltransferase family 4 protein [Clostridia bacterium]